MADLRVSDVTKAARLFDRLLAKADLNKDGAIRSSDVEKIRNQPGVGRIVRAQPATETQVLCVALDTFRRSAAGQGGPTLENIRTVLGNTADKLRARDKDGDGVIGTAERGRSMSAAEMSLAFFAEACKSAVVADFKLPAAHEPDAPRFNWSGTPAKVCQSLLDAYNKGGNDNQWPAWARPDSGAKASRYVVGADEAKAMVAALKPLYASRQRAVLTELASRTQESTYGCVSPNNAGKTVLLAYAAELGLTLEFGQPRAPSMPSP